jgi:hypothetical protein
MKIRLGFVSNSSSSSFLVSFEEEPKNKEAMAIFLFGKNYLDRIYLHPYPYDKEEESWPCSYIAGLVWDDFKDQKPISMEEMIGIVSSGYFKGMPDYHDYVSDIYNNNQIEEYHKLRDLAAEKLLKDFIERLPQNHKIYHFEFHDNEGPVGCAMEHGNLFKRTKYLGVSHH